MIKLSIVIFILFTFLFTASTTAKGNYQEVGYAKISHEPYTNWGNKKNALLAVKEADGYIIEAGEQFSFNETIGPRTEAKGYVEGLMILEDDYVSIIGGGVCRSATAFYQAAQSAGLKIIERHRHSKPVAYAPEDRDATIFFNLMDLKFENNRQYPLKVRSGGDINHIWVQLNPKFRVFIDGKKLDADPKPKIISGRIVVPIRVFSEEFGAYLQWNPDPQSVKVYHEGNILDLPLETTEAQLENGRVIVPLRIIAEFLGAAVDWDGNTREAKVTMPSG